jgi:hypothetical protein
LQILLKRSIGKLFQWNFYGKKLPPVTSDNRFSTKSKTGSVMVCCCREGRNSWTRISLLLTHRSPVENPFYFISAGDFARSSAIIIGTTEPITISGCFMTGYTDNSKIFFGESGRWLPPNLFVQTMLKATVLEQ